MKKGLPAVIAVIIGILVAVPLKAGVRVTTAPEPVESSVALRTVDGKYVSTVTGGFLNLGGEKIGSKQMFTIVDLNGTDLADGDPVKVRYIPGKGTDQTKSSYWVEIAGGIKRNSEGSVFKIKVVDTKFAFQAPSGKFITGVMTDDGLLSVSDKQTNALLLAVVDLSSGIPKTPKKPKTPAPDAAAPAKPATE